MDNGIKWQETEQSTVMNIQYSNNFWKKLGEKYSKNWPNNRFVATHKITKWVIQIKQKFSVKNRNLNIAILELFLEQKQNLLKDEIVDLQAYLHLGCF